jgi:hypothetical protein
MPIRDWGDAINQFAIIYGDRCRRFRLTLASAVMHCGPTTGQQTH